MLNRNKDQEVNMREELVDVVLFIHIICNLSDVIGKNIYTEIHTDSVQ